MGMSLSKLRELVLDREAWRAEIHGVAKSQAQLSDWTELNWLNQAFAFLISFHIANYNDPFSILLLFDVSIFSFHW